MISLTAEEAGSALGLEPLATAVPGVSIDSRSLRAGELFVALRGERFDGHDFVRAALVAGACGAVVDGRWWAGRGSLGEDVQLRESEEVVYPVADTITALGALGHAVRIKSGLIVIAITGSVGKTCTKDLAGAMAGKVRQVLMTTANQNNEIGVPLTLLAIEASTELAVVEMGMRGRGQIEALARMVEPDVGVITNIHPVHLELLGTVEGVAEAKAELLTCLKPEGVAVIPECCPWLQPHVLGAGCRIIRFGLGPGTEGAEVHGSVVGTAPEGGTILSLRWPGGAVRTRIPFVSRHRLENTVAATAACYAAGLPVAECLSGVEQVRFTESRGDVLCLDGLTIINDAYNANPAAVRAALDDLVDLAAQSGGRAVAVLGDMLELGSESELYHREAGAYAAGAGVLALWGVGPLSRATIEAYLDAHGSSAAGSGVPGAVVAEHLASAADVFPLLAGLEPGDVVLFKASRSVGLERLMTPVIEEAKAGAWGQTGGGPRRSDRHRRRSGS